MNYPSTQNESYEGQMLDMIGQLLRVQKEEHRRAHNPRTLVRVLFRIQLIAIVAGTVVFAIMLVNRGRTGL